jgi:hypothetical protein
MVEGEYVYRQNGGSTGNLGLPIAECVFGNTGLSGLSEGFAYQDFENGGLFSVGGSTQVIWFGSPGSKGKPYPFKLPNGSTLNGLSYLDPNTIPKWTLLTFAPDQVTALVENSVYSAIVNYNKTASNTIQLSGEAALQTRSVTNYEVIGARTPIRQYNYGFTLQASAVGDLVGSSANVLFNLYFSLLPASADAPSPPFSISVLPNNPSVTWKQDSVIPVPASDENTPLIESFVTSSGSAIPLPSSAPNVPVTIFGQPATASFELNWISIKVLSDGTLCLLASVLTDSIT